MCTSRQTSKSQSPANLGSVHSAAPSRGVKVGRESRHRQLQWVLRASFTACSVQEEEEEEEEDELSTVQLDSVLFRF